MKFLKLIFVFLLAIIVHQFSSIASAQITVLKQVEKAVVSKSREGAIEKAAKQAAKTSGSKFATESYVKQSSKRVVRNNLSNQLSENGVNSLQKLGVAESKEQLAKKNLGASNKASLVGKSKYKQNVKNPNAKSTYALRHPKGHMNQYVDYNNYSKNSLKVKQELGKGRDKDVLRRNLRKYINKDYAGQGQAHHVVGECSEIAMSKLRLFNIDVNDAMNGIILPHKTGSNLQGSVHKGRNGGDYCRIVDDMFSNCETLEDCYYVLDKLKRQLFNGTLKINNASL